MGRKSKVQLEQERMEMESDDHGIERASIPVSMVKSKKCLSIRHVDVRL